MFPGRTRREKRVQVGKQQQAGASLVVGQYQMLAKFQVPYLTFSRGRLRSSLASANMSCRQIYACQVGIALSLTGLGHSVIVFLFHLISALCHNLGEAIIERGGTKS